MPYARIIVDIPTRALESAFDYAVPPALEADVQVGTTVLVHFSGRACIGYVIELAETPPEGVAPEKIRAIEAVLAPSAFDEVAAQLAWWMSQEYAAPISECLRLFLAPGQSIRIKRPSDTEPYQLVVERTTAVDDRIVVLGKAAQDFEPKKNATRQRMLLEALSEGPVRLCELSVLVAGASSVVKTLEKKGVVHIEHQRRIRGADTTTLSSAQAKRPAQLTEGQAQALQVIEDALAHASGDVVVVDGVTGSGKTEVYLEAIEEVRRQGKDALVLVPEISLTAQTLGRFRSRFHDEVAVLHSRLSVGERYDQWDMARTGQAHIVIGARSALFAPLKNLGLIIIDEEHETSYKQDKQPRYHAREVAAHLSRLRGCTLILGSATPSLESLKRAQDGSFAGARWVRTQMTERPLGAQLPQVSVVDMTHEFNTGNRSIFSQELASELKGCVQRKDKAVLLLNRRGFASFLMCRECGCVPECPHCSTALTYHERTHSLMCHTCGRTWPQRAYPNPSTACPNCGSRYLAQCGIGTQRVEDELRVLLGEEVDIIRMDADTTRTKGAHQSLLERFDASEVAVLIGTQMIAKGLDFPQVTLVGVINADITLKLPDFRAQERTFNLLEQVAGRSGRGMNAGKVVIQTYWATHPCIQAVAQHSRNLFLENEFAERQEAFYPPFSRLANILVWGKDPHAVKSSVADLAQIIREEAEEMNHFEVLGPSACVKERVKDRTRHHLLVKAPADAPLGEILLKASKKLKMPSGINMSIDVDAYDLM